MAKNVFHILEERGFVEQVTDEKALAGLFDGNITCYAGFDPTASSLHVGHLLPVMALAHLQQNGHRPIILVGGGTALIGDPSGKNEMRQILSHDEIEKNAEHIKRQFSQYIDFSTEENALMLNNAQWLVPIKYIEFLRDIGRYFSVNRMIAAESYKMRLETGLNFIEFNYMLLQAYDFLYLSQNYGCILQIGGNDQWGNILAGTDLIRKVQGKTAYGLTFPLITTASGAKMGKTEKGAVWLDKERTSPYEYYQYWINTDDRDVERFLSLFTFLSLEEIRSCLSDIQKAKELLAFEATKLTHGEKQALDARQSARSVFYGDGLNANSLPTSEINGDVFKEGIPAFILFEKTALCKTRSEARRLINEGGAYINGKRIEIFDEKIDKSNVKNGIMLLRAGKKRYHKIIIL